MSILRQNLTITDRYNLTDDLEVAAGVTITVMPGALLNLAGYTLINYGAIVLEGTGTNTAQMATGTYSTDGTTGLLQSTNGTIDGLNIDGFFSNGTLNLSNTVLKNSKVDALISNSIKSCLFLNSSLDLGIESATIQTTSFVNAPISRYAWPSIAGEGQASLDQCNFIGDGILINLDPFFSGGSHNIHLTSAFIDKSSGKSIDDYIYDADDTLRVQTDITPASFSNTPYTNTSAGFAVGNELLRWNGSFTYDTQTSGTTGFTTVTGSTSNDTIITTSSNEHIDGRNGLDIAFYSGTLSQYQINTLTDGTTDIQSNQDGHDILTGIERLQFSDTMVGLDVGKGEHTGEVYRLYLTVLGRNPESDPVGCGFWIDKLDRGILNVEQMVGNFLNSTEFVTRFGGTTNTNESFVNLMYLNLLGRDGHPDSGFTFWLNVLNNHQASREQVVAGFMESPENISNAAPLIGDTPTYQQWAN